MLDLFCCNSEKDGELTQGIGLAASHWLLSYIDTTVVLDLLCPNSERGGGLALIESQETELDASHWLLSYVGTAVVPDMFC